MDAFVGSALADYRNTPVCGTECFCDGTGYLGYDYRNYRSDAVPTSASVSTSVSAKTEKRKNNHK